jgi:hypothetical protein
LPVVRVTIGDTTSGAGGAASDALDDFPMRDFL